MFSSGVVVVSLHVPYRLSATPVHSPSRSAMRAGWGPPFQYWSGQSSLRGVPVMRAMHVEIQVP